MDDPLSVDVVDSLRDLEENSNGHVFAKFSCVTFIFTLAENEVVEVATFTEFADDIESITRLQRIHHRHNVLVVQYLVAVDLISEQERFDVALNLPEFNHFDSNWLTCQ